MKTDSMEMMNRRERKKARTEAEIVAAATSLFQKQGFEGTTMEQIAETADISKGTLYNYFSAKEAILSLYWQDQMHSMQDNVRQIIQQHPDTPTRVLVLFKYVMDLFASRQEFYAPYVRYRLQNLNNPKFHEKLRSGFDVLLADILLLGQKQGDVRTDFPLSMLITHLEGVFIQACTGWLASPKSSSNKSNLHKAVALFFQGASAPPAAQKESTA